MSRARWKKLGRRVALGFGILFGLVMALVIAGGLYLRTHAGKEFVRHQLEKRMSAAIDGQVTIGAVESVRLNRLVVSDLIVTDPQHRPVLSVKHAEINLSPWSLLSHNVILSKVVLHGPSIVATQDPDGQWNAGKLFQPAAGTQAKPGSGSSKPWHIQIGAIELDGGQVALMPRSGQPITLDQLALHASVDWLKDHGKITLPSLTAHWLQRDLPIELSATAELPGPGVYQAHAFHLRVGGLELRAPALTADRHQDKVEAMITLDADAMTVRRLMTGYVQHPEAWLADVHLHGNLGHDPTTGWHGALAGQLGTAIVQAGGGIGATGPANIYVRTIGLTPREIWATAPAARVDATLIAHLQGRKVDQLVGSATVDAHGSAARVRIDMLHATATLDHGKTTWTASFATDRGHGHSEGEAELKPLHIDRAHLVARVDHRELVRLAPQLRALGGVFEVDVTASGAPTDLTASGTLTGTGIRYQDVRARVVQVHGTVRGLPGAPVGEVTLAVKQGTRQGKAIGPLIADAKFSDGGRRIAVAITAAGGPTLPYAGHATAVVLRAPRTTTIQLGTLAITTRGLAWHAAGGTVVLQPRGRIDVNGIQLVSSAGTVELTGTLDSRRAALSSNRLHVHVIDVDLARVQRALALERPALAGIINIDAHLERANHLLALDLTASGKGVSWQRGLPMLDAELHATVANGHFDGKAQVTELKTHGSASVLLTAVAPKNALDLAEWQQTDMDEIEHFEVDLARMRLETAMLFAGPPAPGSSRIAVTGMVSGRALVEKRGTPLETDLTFTNVAARGLRGIDATVKSHWDKQRLTVALTSRLAGSNFLSGQLTLAKGIPNMPGKDLVPALLTAPATGRAEIARFSLQKLVAINLVQKPLGGVLDAHLTLTGTLTEPTGHFDLKASKAQFGKIGFSELTASGDGDRRGVKVAITGKETQGGFLKATATLPVGRLQPVALTVQAQRFDLSFVQALATSPASALNDVTGRLDADLRINGTRAKPNAQGRASLRDGRLFVPGSTFGELYGVEVDVALKQDQVTLSRFQASSGKGKVNITGSAHLLGVMPDSFQADIKSDKMLVHAGSTLAAVDIDIHADGHHVETTWEVTANVKSGTVYLPRKMPGKLQPTGALDDVIYVDNLSAEARRKAMIELANRGQQLPSLRLAVTTSDILVTGPAVHAWTRANLKLALTPDGTSIRGNVRLRGDVTLFGRRYELTEARATFDGAIPPVPQLRVKLTHEFRTMTLSIQVTGTSKKPILKLMADPPNYSDAQLAGFILGGDPDDASQAEGSPSAEQQAADAAAGLIASAVQSQLADALPIDVLRLEVGDGMTTGPSIEVGKWLTTNLLLGYRYRTPTSQANQNSNEVLLEYRFGKRWMLEGSYGNAGAGDADVLWSKRY